MINKKLWSPSNSLIENSNIFEFQKNINNKYNLSISNYLELHKWSVDNIDSFWKEVWAYSQVIYSKSYTDIIKHGNNIWETEWFLNSKFSC